MEATPEENSALELLAECLQVEYLDHHTASKDLIKQTFLQERAGGCRPAVEISTCLRLERYYIGNHEAKNPGLHHCQGMAAVRRLLGVAVGLHSELIGEREILHQVERAVCAGIDQQTFPSQLRSSFTTLLELAKRVRQSSGITVEENYSTIGAALFQQKLRQMNSPTIMVVGAGYMVKEFLSSLVNFAAKVIWANRSFASIKQASETLSNITLESIVCARLEDCSRFFPLVDGVFAAVPGRDFSFTAQEILRLPKHALLVDVSYPPVFPDSSDRQLISIANSSFVDFAEKRAPRASIVAAQKAIESLTPARLSSLNVGLAA